MAYVIRKRPPGRGLFLKGNIFRHRQGRHPCVKKFPGVFRAYLMGFPVYAHRHAPVLALAHTETGFEVDPVMEGLFLD
jgi:hypothetical protein